jgi:hypothetical protein
MLVDASVQALQVQQLQVCQLFQNKRDNPLED